MLFKQVNELPPLKNKRLMGLDVGEKTIGLALSDLSQTIASPLETIRRGKFSVDVQMLPKLIT